LSVQIADRTELGPDDEAMIATAFEAEYRRVYGVLPATKPALEVLNWRVFAAGQSGARTFSWPEAPAAHASDAALRPRRIFRADLQQMEEVPVYDRYRLPPGSRLQGPVVLQEAESTLVVPVRGVVEVMPTRSVLVTLTEAA
jgi:N-methylhydantoinase A